MKRVETVLDYVKCDIYLGGTGKMYRLARTDDELYINDYNPTLLLAWEGNIVSCNTIKFRNKTGCVLKILMYVGCAVCWAKGLGSMCLCHKILRKRRDCTGRHKGDNGDFG